MSPVLKNFWKTYDTWPLRQASKISAQNTYKINDEEHNKSFEGVTSGILPNRQNKRQNGEQPTNEDDFAPVTKPIWQKNRKMDSLRVRKVLQVGCFKLGKTNHGMGSLQVLKVIRQEFWQLRKISSRVDSLEVLKMFIKINSTNDIPTKSNTCFTTCIFTSTSITRRKYGIKLRKFVI